MKICIDIGNSNISCAFLTGYTVEFSYQIPTKAPGVVEEYCRRFEHFIRNKDLNSTEITATVISSVVPEKTDQIRNALHQCGLPPPFLIRPGIRTGLRINYNPPQALGADRVVNAVAAKILYGFPAIIIDSGTATTLSVLNSNSEFDGGIIFPGFHSLYTCLHSSTALLPEVNLVEPEKYIGKSTVACIQSGLFFGYQAMLDGLVSGIRAELKEVCHIIATGGFFSNYKTRPHFIDYFDPDLIFKGLSILYDLNQSKSGSEICW